MKWNEPILKLKGAPQTPTGGAMKKIVFQEWEPRGNICAKLKNKIKKIVKFCISKK